MLDTDNLFPDFRDKLTDFVLEANYQGLPCDVFSAYRSVQEQDRLYAQGRNVPGSIITNAKGGHSWHNWGLAADVVFKSDTGNWMWDVEPSQWHLLAAIAKARGLEWGGDFPGQLIDEDHFQLTHGLTIAHAITLGTKEAVWAVL
jgi:peptidoglycan L-alanyl-D-glutamate endopeptidase CwlK